MAWTDPPRTWVNGEIPTQTEFNTHLRDQLKELWHEVAYVEFTADVTVTTASTEASPLDVVSSGAITYAAYPTIIEFFSPLLICGSTLGLSLWDASTDLGRIQALSGGSFQSGGWGCRRFTPTAASHTYKVRAWASASNGTVKAGAGGVGTYMPGYIRVLVKGGA